MNRSMVVPNDYVESIKLVLPFVCIMLLSTVDSLLTLSLLKHGFIELNPLMSVCMKIGDHFFLIVKWFLTLTGVSLLFMNREHSFILNGLDGWKIGCLIAFGYVLLVAFEIFSLL